MSFAKRRAWALCIVAALSVGVFSAVNAPEIAFASELDDEAVVVATVDTHATANSSESIESAPSSVSETRENSDGVRAASPESVDAGTADAVSENTEQNSSASPAPSNGGSQEQRSAVNVAPSSGKAQSLVQQNNTVPTQADSIETSAAANSAASESSSPSSASDARAEQKHASEFVEKDGHVYYYDEKGDVVKDSEAEVDLNSGASSAHPAGTYYFDASGFMKTGWFNSVKRKGTVYYKPTGAEAFGSYILGETEATDEHPAGVYWFDPSTGVVLVNSDVCNDISVDAGKPSTLGWRFYRSDGTMATGEVLRNDDAAHTGWYYFDPADGTMQYSWRFVSSNGGKWVYYDPTTGIMHHGECAVTGSGGDGWCYFDDYTGATTYEWRYLASSGGKWVYYHPVTGRMLYGEQAVIGSGGDGWCYFDVVTGATNYEWKYLVNGHKWVYYDPYTGRMWHQNGVIWGVWRAIDGITGAVDVSATRLLQAAGWMCEIAADPSHGYDQQYRLGQRGDYDCSSFVITALSSHSIDVGGATYTGNMRSGFLSTGKWIWLTNFNQLRTGDVLLRQGHHTAMYLGNKWLVHASGNELGRGAIGGKPGDQDGLEICERTYYWYPWDGFLRYVG